MTIRTATVIDIPVIHRLAEEIWWPTYQDILAGEQIRFMLDKMYSEEALMQQLTEEGIEFLLCEEGRDPLAFAAFSLTDQAAQVYKIHKVYVMPNQQGKGLGRALIDHITKQAAEKGGKVIELNVNRNNPAYHFYKKAGFAVYQEVDIPYYHFFMNDYVMRKEIK